ncbi:unnamed protein product [Spirodela intermedia]|uniref:Uncharacterized protein n=1 Tax=Spirodela intermedia TaxID=51605 RepID=A0A7I8INM8_SPIIN|nr:unnamed protein product [Spirodela intermedia]CAA6659478.1 unnamed protein product [Spirodela intermedia]
MLRRSLSLSLSPFLGYDFVIYPSKGSGGGLLAKAAIGTVVVGAAVAAAYQTGFVSDPQFKLEGPFISKKVEVSQRAAEKEYSQDQVNFSGKETSHGSSKLEVTENIHEHRQIDGAETIESDASKDLGLVEDELTPVKEDVSSSFHEDVPTQDEEGSVSEILSSSKELSDLKEEPVLVKEDESLISSLDVSPQSEEGSVSEISSVNSVSLEGSGEINVSQDQKIVLDFIDAIHAAEKKQAESDFRFFDMEKQKMKEKYEKELKDARARELMYAEEAAILDKELNRERVKAAATAKLLQEKAEEHLRVELQRKEEEIESMLKKIQEMGKAELNAAIAKEKSSHMEKMSEANLNIKALCMAFYARSEEARQNYSIHKLALGALALENALSKGLPIKAEVDSLHSSLVGLDKDSLLDLVLATLPEETLTNGTNTLLQLSQKFVMGDKAIPMEICNYAQK